MREAGDLALQVPGRRRRGRARGRIGGARHQRRGIGWEHQSVEEVGVVQEEVALAQPVVRLHRRVVDLRDARVEDPRSRADHQRPLLPDGIRQPYPRREVVAVEGHLARVRPQRVGDQSLAVEGLQVPAQPQAERQVVAQPDAVLREQRVLLGVGVRHRRAEVLDVVPRHLVRPRPQRRDPQPEGLRLEGERVHPDVVVDVLPAEQRGKEVVQPHQAHVAAELEGVPPRLPAHRLGDVQPVLVGLPRQDGGAPEALDDVVDPRQRRCRVGLRPLPVARELHPQVAHRQGT